MPLPTIPPPFDVILKFPRLDPQAIYFFFFKPHLERGGPLRKKKAGGPNDPQKSDVSQVCSVCLRDSPRGSDEITTVK